MPLNFGKHLMCRNILRIASTSSHIFPHKPKYGAKPPLITAFISQKKESRYLAGFGEIFIKKIVDLDPA